MFVYLKDFFPLTYFYQTSQKTTLQGFQDLLPVQPVVQASRIDGKAKQRIILYLGSDPLLQDKTNRVIVLEILKSKIFGQDSFFPRDPAPVLVQLEEALFKKYQIKYVDAPSRTPPFHQLRIRQRCTQWMSREWK